VFEIKYEKCFNLCSGSCFCDADNRQIPHEDVRAAPSQPILEVSVVTYLQDVHIMYEGRVIDSRGNAKENENEILPIGPFPATRYQLVRHDPGTGFGYGNCRSAQ